jgi:hypothetical protein
VQSFVRHRTYNGIVRQTIATQCLQNGRWYRDFYHRLFRSEESAAKLERKATRIIVCLDLSGEDFLVETIFENSLLFKASSEPFVDVERPSVGRREIIWPMGGTLPKVCSGNIYETQYQTKTNATILIVSDSFPPTYGSVHRV